MEEHLEDSLKELEECQRQLSDVDQIRDFNESINDKNQRLAHVNQDILQQNQHLKDLEQQLTQENHILLTKVQTLEQKLNDYQREFLHHSEIYSLMEDKNRQLQSMLEKVTAGE